MLNLIVAMFLSNNEIIALPRQFKKEKQNSIKTALTYKRIYQSLNFPTIRETAQIIGVSKGRAHQILNLLKLDERILVYLVQDKTGENYT